MKKKDIFERLRGDMDQIPVPYQWNKIAGAAAQHKPRKAAQPRPQHLPVYRKVWSMAAAAAMLLLVITAVMVNQRQPWLRPDPLISTADGPSQSYAQPDTTEPYSLDPQQTDAHETNGSLPTAVNNITNPSNNTSKTAPSAPSQTRSSAPELATIPSWDSRTIAEKFPSIAWNATEYVTSSNTSIPSGQIGSLLGKYRATGHDYSQSSQPEYQADCEIYSIRNISSACAVAVKFAGTAIYLPYMNVDYRPGTLGNLIDDLNLRENLRFNNKIYYDYREGEEFVQMEYSLPDPSVIWTMLLSDTSLKNVASMSNPGIDLAVMSCSIDVNVIGQRNIALSVTENGYLTTNILATEKRFFIGKDAVNRFVAYVQEHGSGRRLTVTPGVEPVLE
ncbi:MAG: hypothetical protein FWC27_01570 [Firmicutes bacterium]|nr:hypothetical protein [Bacillota bacterium]